MITLISVRLKNFRAVKDATLTPLTEGVTGLSGPNGAGKTAFLIGTLWALYGEVPRNTVTASLRNDDSTHDEECFVQVEFDHNGDRIIVTRNLVGKNNNATLFTWVNGNENTVTGVKEGQRWITKRLGVDAQGFTTAVLVKQKELDELVDAKPSERRALIERLSGISKMSAARKAARDEANLAKRDADNAPGDADTIKEITETLEEYNTELENAEANATKFKNDLDALRESYNDALDKLNTAKVVSQKHKDILVNRTHAEEALTSVREDLTRITERVTQIRAELPEEEFNPEVTAKLREEIASLEGSISTKTREADATLAQANHKAENGIREVERAEDDLKTKQEEKSATAETLASLPTADVDELNQTRQTLEVEAQSLRDRMATNQALITSLQESIDALGDKDECPLCLQGIHDNSELLARLNGTQKAHEKSIEEAQVEWDKNRAAYQEVNDALAKQNERQRVAEKLSAIEEQVNDLTEARDNAKSHADGAKKALVDAQMASETLMETIEQEREKLTATRETLDSYAAIESTMRSLADAEKELQRLTERESSSKARYDKTFTDEEENGDVPTEEEITSLQNTHDELMAAGVSRKDDYAEAVSDVKVWRERISSAESNLKQAEAALEAKRALLERAERTAAVANTLDEFRTAQIARVAPELADTATNLISQMTRGRFTEITLDEDFTPSVVDDSGQTQPVSRLSGGELSVVALALRIAIGDMLTGGSGGLLWLDEVLTAQDADRRASLMETLRSLSSRQIVMINHTQGADDIVDRTIRLRASEEGGTVLDEG